MPCGTRLATPPAPAGVEDGPVETQCIGATKLLMR